MDQPSTRRSFLGTGTAITGGAVVAGAESASAAVGGARASEPAAGHPRDRPGSGGPVGTGDETPPPGSSIFGPIPVRRKMV